MEYSRLYEREDLMDGDVGEARLCRSRGQSPEIAVAVRRLFDLARIQPCNKEMAEVAVVELLVEQTEASRRFCFTFPALLDLGQRTDKLV